MFNFKKPQKSFVGIDITTTAVKIVSVSIENQVPCVENLLVIPVSLSANSQNTVEAALSMSETFSQIKEIANNNAALAVPISICAQQRIKIEPDMDMPKIEAMVKSKINNISPYQPTDTAFDYFVTLEGEDRFLNIGATKKEWLEKHVNIVASSEAKPVVATGGGFAFEKVIPLLFNQEQLSQNIALFNIGFNETAVYLLDAGKLVYSKESNFGIADTVDGMASFYNISQEEALNKLVQNSLDDTILQDTFMTNLFADIHQMLVREIKVFMLNAVNFNVDKLYLSGDFATIPHLVDYLNNENRFRIELFNPFANMRIAGHVNIQDVTECAPIMLDALIAAASIKPGGLNLMPWRETLANERKKQFLTGLITSAITGALLMGGAWGYQSNQLKNHQAATNVIRTAINDDKAKIAALGDIDAKKKQVAERLQVISNLQDKRFELVKALNYFVMNFPDHAYLTEMSKQGDMFTIRGRARNSDMVVQLIRSLRFYPYFNDVTVTQWVGDSANPDGTLGQSEIKSDGWGSFVITFTISSAPHAAITNNEVYLPPQSVTNAPINGIAPPINGNVHGQMPNGAPPANPLAGLNPNQASLASAAGVTANALLGKESIKPAVNPTIKVETSTKTQTTAH